MEEELLAYFFHHHGVRNIRFAPPEVILPLHRTFTTLSKKEKIELIAMYKKNKSKVFKLLEL